MSNTTGGSCRTWRTLQVDTLHCPLCLPAQSDLLFQGSSPPPAPSSADTYDHHSLLRLPDAFARPPIRYDPSEVLVSAGAKQCIFQAIHVLCRPGDEVVVISPYWVSYIAMAKLAGATVRVVEASAAHGFIPMCVCVCVCVRVRGRVCDVCVCAMCVYCVCVCVCGVRFTQASIRIQG